MPKLTVKQRKFIKNKAQGMSGAEAARKAGYSEKTAKSTASENMTKPDIRDAFLKAMNKEGITDKHLSKVMKDGLGASRTVSAISGKDANAGTVDFVDVPDHHARHKFLKTAVDIKGVEAAKKVEATVSHLEDSLDDLDDGQTESDSEEAEG